MASKSKSRRRVFRASCILAALIVAGSSFAWFTSSDEVTNRLTASANYGVSIVEDFTPPKVMVPGQEVDKDVAVVNTGSVDALARVHLTNVLKVQRVDYLDMITDSSADQTATANVTSATTVAAETVHYLDLEDNEIKTKSKADWDTLQTTNSGTTKKLYSTYDYSGCVNTVATGKLTDEDKLSKTETYAADGVTLRANEVTTLQAGGKLVVMKSESVVPKSERSGDDGEVVYIQVTDNSNRPIYKIGSNLYVIVGGEYYKVTPTTDSSTGVTTYAVSSTKESTAPTGDATPLASQIAYKDFDGSAQFLPSETGIYIFERTAYDDPNLEGTTNTEYSGYYYVAGSAPGAGDYYAFKTKTKSKNSGSVDPEAPAKDYQVTPYIDATFTKDTGSGIISKIEDLELKYTTPMQDYTGYFTNATKDDSGYYKKGTGADDTEPEVIFTWLKSDGATETTAGAADAAMIKVDYTFGNNTGANANITDDVVFFINLDSKWHDNWTYVAEGSTTPVAISDKTNALGYFYYNSPIDSGKTSEKLITSVTLDSATTPFAYKNLVYDLNVLLDSVQVTYLADNTETADVAKETWHTNAKDVNLASTYDTDGKSIKSIAWSDYS